MAQKIKFSKNLVLYDIKFKKSDGDIFQNQRDIKNLNSLINSIKEKESKMTEQIDENKNNDETKFNDFTKQIRNK